MIMLRSYNVTIILDIRYKLTSIKVNATTYVQLVFVCLQKLILISL